MDCGFNINHVLPEEITVIDAGADCWKNTSVGGGRDYLRQQIGSVIDRIGEASAQAQGLLSAVTSAAKLRASDHRLYILKDATANQNHGGVLGYLKVARKKLWLSDGGNREKCEYEPLCVLDFFIDPAHQRKGHGVKLLNFALQRERVKPEDVAIDRPSPKLLAFMGKHYGLTQVVRQASHFVVFAEFFMANNGKVSSPTDPSKENGDANRGRGGVFNRSSFDLADDVRDRVDGKSGSSEKVANGEAGKGHKGEALEDALGGHMRKTSGRNLHYEHTQLW